MLDLDGLRQNVNELLENDDETLRLETIQKLESEFTETLDKLNKYKEDNVKLRNKVWLGTSVQEPTKHEPIEQIPTKKTYENLVNEIIKGGKI